MPGQRYLPENRLPGFLDCVGSGRSVANAKIDDAVSWKSVGDVTPEQIAAGLRAERPAGPFKSVLMPARELVARYGAAAEGDPLDEVRDCAVTLIGLRGHECIALGYLDAVMLGEPQADPFYQLRREQATIISVDCVAAAASCFCNLLGNKAFAEKNFDLNLSPIDGGYVVESGSDKGEGLIEKAGGLLQAAAEDHIKLQEAMRQRTADQLQEQNSEYSCPEQTPDWMPDSSEEPFWWRELAKCVQCGGCTAVCPTCFCFMLYDQQAGSDRYERLRTSDSCQFTGYSQMAGVPGGPKPDPRRSHMSKFQRRFFHKFVYDPRVMGMYGCVGCGRCGQTCPGEIDLRRVLSDLTKEPVQNG